MEAPLGDPLSTLQTALADRYRIERRLGSGGMATVYLARDLRHDRPVALKVLRPELAASLGADRFLREIRLAARLQHPHILSVHDSGDAGGELWFTMPFVEGESLRDRLTRERQLPLDDAIRIAREAAQALRYAHEHGVVHRDVKPENLLLTTDGSTLVADFGIARALAAEDERLTSTGLVLGTPAYMSPEQASGEREVDARSDVYSLGCVLYEMLAGEAPFTGPTAQSVIAKRLAGAAPSVTLLRPGLPPGVVRTVERALALVPADRFGGMADFSRALEPSPTPDASGQAYIAASAATRTSAPSTVGRIPTQRSRRVGVRILAAAGVLAAGTFGLRAAGLWPSQSLVASGRLAPRDQLVLADFIDRTNDSSLATAITEAFRVDFQQSGLVGLANPDLVRGTLRFMQRPDSVRLTPELAREVAQRSGLKAVLTGEVTRLGDGYQVSAQVIGADSGQVLAARRETAATSREIIPAVDRLSRGLRSRVGEPLRRIRAAPPLAQVTTASLDALRKYGLASRLMGAGHARAAAPLFEEAVQLDTGFAMAWHALGVALWNLQTDPARQAEATTRAYERRDRLTDRQRYATEAEYHEWVKNDRVQARAAYAALLELDSNHVAALTNLGLLTWFENDYTTAAALASRAIRVDSTAYAPYTNLVDAQVSLGQFAAADTTYARWRARFGDGEGYHVLVGVSAAARFDYDSAARSMARGLSHPDDAVYALDALARVAAARGRLAEARGYGRRATELAGSRRHALMVMLTEPMAEVYLGLDHGEPGGVLDQAASSTEFARADPKQHPSTELALVYAMAGRGARARELSPARQPGPDATPFAMATALEGALLLSQGRYPEAGARFRAANTITGGLAWLPELGLTLDRAGQTDSALAIYERYLNSSYNYRIYFDAARLAPVLKRTAELHEAKGNRTQALERYRQLADQWRGADPKLGREVAEVKRRIGELTAETR